MSSLPDLVLTFWSSPSPHYDSQVKLRYRLISQAHFDFRTIVPCCPQINFILDPDSSSLSMVHCSSISEDLFPERNTQPCSPLTRVLIVLMKISGKQSGAANKSPDTGLGCNLGAVCFHSTHGAGLNPPKTTK